MDFLLDILQQLLLLGILALIGSQLRQLDLVVYLGQEQFCLLGC